MIMEMDRGSNELEVDFMRMIVNEVAEWEKGRRLNPNCFIWLKYMFRNDI